MLFPIFGKSSIMLGYVASKFASKAFHCPLSTVKAHQNWYAVSTGNQLDEYGVTMILPDSTMGIPQANRVNIVQSDIVVCQCTSCEQYSVWKLEFDDDENRISEAMIYPKAKMRPVDLTHVPAHHAQDFREACLVLDDSPKASAALSRRCLHAVLREQGFKARNLEKEIEAAMASSTLTEEI